MVTSSRYDPTTLGYAILGMLGREPMSGYRIRKLFETTPLGHYSSSPGTIYPALKRLEQAGLVRRSTVKADGQKPRKVFTLTGGGRDRLQGWLQTVPDELDVVHDLPECLLRFSLMGDDVTAKHKIHYLDRFRVAASAYVRHLRRMQEDLAEHMTGNTLLALENGIAVYRAHARWAARAHSQLLADSP